MRDFFNVIQNINLGLSNVIIFAFLIIALALVKRKDKKMFEEQREEKPILYEEDTDGRE